MSNPASSPPSGSGARELKIAKKYWPCIKGRYTPPEAARMLLKTHTMADITRASMLLGLTWGEANKERSRLFSERYGI